MRSMTKMFIVAVFVILLGWPNQLVFSQAKKGEKEVKVTGTIDSCDFDSRELRLVKDGGGRENLSIGKNLVVLAGDRRVSPSVLKKGMKATVTYAEEEGEPVPGMGVPIIIVARQVVVDASVKDESSAPVRFVDNGDGTVTDTKTKLMWQKGDSGKKYTYDQAVDYCKNLKLGGRTDWRLPKTEEKDTAVVAELMMPKHDKEGHADHYWSADSTVLLTFNYPTTHMALSNAYGATKESKAYVRAVCQAADGDANK